MANTVGQYSFLDRMIHRLAFSGVGVQMTAADIEDKIFQAELASTAAENPIFITSLPRAGTTILLVALASVPGMATHLYRDMPFVMAPLLWNQISARFRQSAELQERAHGDGIKIGMDSPEAFEEVIWRAFWPDHFRKNDIVPWDQTNINDDASAFFDRHLRKIVALRIGSGQTGRYISKNNANIARLDLLPDLFPGANVIVPVRQPIAHAASLLRQHQNFMTRHTDDPFTRRYMGDIGHYEFGHLHKPISFTGFAELSKGFSPSDIDYWLAYWIAAFETVKDAGDHVHLLRFESFCEDGRQGATRLCDILNIDQKFANQIGNHFHPAPLLDDGVARHKSPLRDEAEALHASLFDKSAHNGI
ncbi:MAG: sulfotransferase [Paracoccaceae bacterium]